MQQKKYSFYANSRFYQKYLLPLHQQIPPASRKISVPSGTFLFMGVRYTHQAITTEQQIEILKERGLLIDDVKQAIEILDTISYFRLAGYW